MFKNDPFFTTSSNSKKVKVENNATNQKRDDNNEKLLHDNKDVVKNTNGPDNIFWEILKFAFNPWVVAAWGTLLMHYSTTSAWWWFAS